MRSIKNIKFGSVEDIASLTLTEPTRLIIPGFIREKYYPDYDQPIDGKHLLSMYHQHLDECDNRIMAIQVMCREFGEQRGLRLEIDNNPYADVTVDLIGYNFSKMAKYWLKYLAEDDDDESINFPRMGNEKSERSSIHGAARHLGIDVFTTLHPNHWEVSLDKPDKSQSKHAKKTNGNVGLMGAIDAWLNTLTIDHPTAPPLELLEVTTDSYFRTVLNKSTYTLSYRKGLVTRHSHIVRKRDGVYQVVVNDQVIGTHHENDARVFNLMLAPHGYTLEG